MLSYEVLNSVLILKSCDILSPNLFTIRLNKNKLAYLLLLFYKNQSQVKIK